MARRLTNPWRGRSLLDDVALPSSDPSRVAHLLTRCPAHAETPLLAAEELADEAGVAQLWLKDERSRMGLGSFKALGAAFAIACDAADHVSGDWGRALAGTTFVTASAGNHGLSVAAGARVFGARAVIFIAETVPEAFADRLRARGAEVRRAGATYEAAMAAAEGSASTEGWQLLSDSSWPGYAEPAHRVMEGYLQLAAEAADQLPAPPTHILLQAGVGGMAAAVAAHARRVWGDAPDIVIVESDFAPALFDSIAAGRCVTSGGPVSAMGRLDCKTPSLIGLQGLARDADLFVTLTEEDARAGVDRLARHGLATTPSGAAGVSALLAGLDLPPDACVLAILTEGPEDG